MARAGTVHVGGTAAEVVAAEGDVQRGRHPERPFVLVTQPTQFDGRRAPAGVHVAWGYCHVPNGSTVDMTAAIEAQIERFAPGFRDRIVARHVMGPAAIERHDANYVGGDIAGGRADLRQFFARPVLGLHPWRMPAERLVPLLGLDPAGSRRARHGRPPRRPRGARRRPPPLTRAPSLRAVYLWGLRPHAPSAPGSLALAPERRR